MRLSSDGVQSRSAMNALFQAFQELQGVHLYAIIPRAVGGLALDGLTDFFNVKHFYDPPSNKLKKRTIAGGDCVTLAVFVLE